MKTETKVAHTPTPWKAAGLGIFTDEMQIANIHPGKFTRDGKRHPDESVPWPAITEGEANAAFIVKAVNTHEELLKRLKEACLTIKLESAETTPFIRQMEKVIVKAEGK